MTTTNLPVVSSDRYRKGVPPAFPESQPKYLQDELSKLERITDLSYQDTLGVVASVTTEITERKAADYALADQLTTLKAQTDKAAADITVEYTARVQGDDALAAAITKLNATVGSNTAAIIAEYSARATGDQANADALTALTATVNNNTAAIVNESTVRASGDKASADAIASLTATVNSNTASITSESSARVSGDKANADAITSLTATVNNNTAAITNESSARATGDKANADAITALTATVNNNTAAISNESSVRASGDKANADAISSLTATVNSNTAAISNESSARASGDQANAQSISSLTTTVNGNTASITQQAQSINGLQLKWGIQLNNNNRVTGISLNSGAASTSFDVQADTFNIYTPAGDRNLYWDGANLVVRGNILATSITADAITQTINAIPAQTIGRPIVGKPTVVAQGTYNQTFTVGSTNSTVSITIPTGVSVGSDWTQASSDLYIATATIAAGTSTNGGNVGRSLVSVVVGDGISSSGAKGYYADGQIYINYQFSASAGQGSFTATAINWKLSRI